MIQTVNNIGIKTIATKLRNELAAFGYEINHSNSLNILARSFGYKSYSAFAALSKEKDIIKDEVAIEQIGLPLSNEIQQDASITQILTTLKYIPGNTNDFSEKKRNLLSFIGAFRDSVIILDQKGQLIQISVAFCRDESEAVCLSVYDQFCYNPISYHSFKGEQDSRLFFEHLRANYHVHKRKTHSYVFDVKLKLRALTKEVTKNRVHFADKDFSIAITKKSYVDSFGRQRSERSEEISIKYKGLELLTINDKLIYGTKESDIKMIAKELDFMNTKEYSIYERFLASGEVYDFEKITHHWTENRLNNETIHYPTDFSFDKFYLRSAINSKMLLLMIESIFPGIFEAIMDAHYLSGRIDSIPEEMFEVFEKKQANEFAKKKNTLGKSKSDMYDFIEFGITREGEDIRFKRGTAIDFIFGE